MQPLHAALIIAMLTAVANAAEPDKSTKRDDRVSKAVAGITKLGGAIKYGQKGSVIGVYFIVNEVSDSGLVHLEGLNELRSLFLFGPRSPIPGSST